LIRCNFLQQNQTTAAATTTTPSTAGNIAAITYISISLLFINQKLFTIYYCTLYLCFQFYRNREKPKDNKRRRLTSPLASSPSKLAYKYIVELCYI
jgi:hypothetical protein